MSELLLQSSVSNGHSEIILWFAAKETFLIIINPKQAPHHIHQCWRIIYWRKL